MLEVSGLSVSYGKHLALSDVALNVGRGEIVVVLGANGAGKSDAAQGDRRPCRARARRLDPAAATSTCCGLPPHEIVEAGIALVPEGRGIFDDLTVRENLLLGAYAAGRAPASRRCWPACSRCSRGWRSGSASTCAPCRAASSRWWRSARALMSAPDMLLLDEPSLGLPPLMCKELFQALAGVRGSGVGILLVEQNARAGPRHRRSRLRHRERPQRRARARAEP